MFMLPFFDPSLKLGKRSKNNTFVENISIINIFVKHKSINCHDMWFNWAADVSVYVSLICHINNDDPAKLW